MPHQFIKKRRLESLLVEPKNDPQYRSEQDPHVQGFQQLAATQGPTTSTVVPPNLDALIQSLPEEGSVGSLNLSPVVSAVSAPTWMSLNSPRPTNTPTTNSVSSANPATPTSSVSHPSSINTVKADHSGTSSKMEPLCSDSTQCASMTASMVSASSSASATPSPGSPGGANNFLASLGSSPGSIFVTTLVGLAILGVIFAIASWGLRRWCNRRRRKAIDDDTWGFLNTPKEFAKGPSEDDGLSEKSMGLGFSGSLPHVLLHNDVPHDLNANSAFLPVFHPSQPRLSCLMDEGKMNWMNNSAAGQMRSSLYGGVILAPIGSSTTDHLAAPEPAYGSARADISQLQGACAGLTDGSNPAPNLKGVARPRSVIPPVKTEDNTPLTALPPSLTSRIRRHPLAREVSIARSDVSSTVEILRARVEDQKTDIRSKLFGAIQSAKAQEQSWSPSDVISAPLSDSAYSPYVPADRVQPATPRPLQVVKNPSLVRHQLTDQAPSSPPQLNRQGSQASCYSVSTTVIGSKKN